LADLLVKIALGIGAAGAVLAVARLLKGPDAPDRAVALDVLTLITLPLLVGVAAAEGRLVYLDVAVVYALLSFLGVVALARYYDRGV